MCRIINNAGIRLGLIKRIKHQYKHKLTNKRRYNKHVRKSPIPMYLFLYKDGWLNKWVQVFTWRVRKDNDMR